MRLKSSQWNRLLLLLILSYGIFNFLKKLQLLQKTNVQPATSTQLNINQKRAAIHAARSPPSLVNGDISVTSYDELFNEHPKHSNAYMIFYIDSQRDRWLRAGIYDVTYARDEYINITTYQPTSVWNNFQLISFQEDLKVSLLPNVRQAGRNFRA